MYVPILLGSESDKAHAQKIADVLTSFGVTTEFKVFSAHKVPEKLFAFIQECNKKKGPIVYITIAGRSNGLSGVTAGNAIHPVIACPPFADKADYLVNIHSSLQMPSDTPAMTVIDPKNAAMAALRILALSDETLKKKVEAGIREMKAKF
ncbi:AIR carboxylase family protein [Candidatus Peregrinibacteria bacterium]|nr:AIR carboxylase family protein [Candidatus Peregrinibacteria bacterium]